MDVSIKNIKNQIGNKPSFTGVKGDYNNANIPVFKFKAPPYNKDLEKATLEIAFLNYDEIKNNTVFESNQIITCNFDENDTFNLPQDKVNGYSAGIGYRYKFTKKDGTVRYATDDFVKINLQNDRNPMNVIKLWGSNMINSKNGSMTHRFIDSDSILEEDGKLTSGKKPSRNHFNVYGGSTKALIELIKSGEFDPYRYIITNPDLGNDKMSSHRYWPCNLYQCSDIQDFKDINWELFTRGKGYVADGAFTSQGIESPMLQHIFKWGEESPFYSMFKFDNPEGVIYLGLLPEHDFESEVDEFSHLGVRIVNNPNNNERYNPNKPVYVQFYDDRLASPEQIANTDKLIEKYDIQPDDIFEISSYDDSMYPYYFELNPNSPIYHYKEKIKPFKEKDFMSLNELDETTGVGDFCNFGKFRITSRSRAGSATFWDGNRDIIKLNLTNSHEYTDSDYAEENKDGMKKARNYVFGAAEFWSETIQGDLILRTAHLCKNKNKLMEIMSKNDIENPQKILNTKNRIYPILKENKTLDKYIINFPLQSIETSPEVSAIFAQSDFNEIMLEYNDFVEKYEVAPDGSIFKKDNEYSFDNIEDDDNNMFIAIYTMANDIIDNVISGLPKELTDNKKEYKTYLLKTYANDILKCIYAGALNPDCLKKGKIDTNELKNITLRPIIREHTYPVSNDAGSAIVEKRAVISKIRRGLENIDCESIEQRIRKEVKDISLEDFKNSETVILQSKAGLNWRFDAAKDIGDMDSIRADAKRFRDIWDEKDGVVDFWNQFIDKARKYNPSAYIIAEITNLWDFYNSAPHDDFDVDEYNPNIKEKDFLHKINASTSSDYSNFFNKLSCFIGTNPEKLNDESNHPLSRSGNLNALRGNYIDFLRGNQAHNAHLTHLFFENHDKPRTLHSLPLDMEMFLCDDGNIMGVNAVDLKQYLDLNPDKKVQYGKNIRKLTHRSDIQNLSSKAVAVGLMMQKYIDTIPSEPNKHRGFEFGYTDVQKAALQKALGELVNGQRTSDSPFNNKRANAFATQAYEVTIKELLTRAGITDNIDERVRDFRYNMLKNYIEYEQRMWQMVNALVGVPTMYNGMEFAQTGYETPSKNQYVNNRNQIMHSDVQDKRFKDLYDKLYAISNLYRYPNLSAIRDGEPFVCKINENVNKQPFIAPDEVDVGNLDYCVKKIEQRFTIDGFKEFMSSRPTIKTIQEKCGIDQKNAECIAWYHFGFENEKGDIESLIEKYWKNKINNSKYIDILPVVKYDDKGSVVLSVVTNNGIPRYQFSYNSEEKIRDFEVDSINLQNDGGLIPLPEGTELKKMVYDRRSGMYKKENNGTYIIKNGILRNKDDNKKIKLEDTVVNFYVPSQEENESEIYAKYAPSAYFAKK